MSTADIPNTYGLLQSSPPPIFAGESMPYQKLLSGFILLFNLHPSSTDGPWHATSSTCTLRSETLTVRLRTTKADCLKIPSGQSLITIRYDLSTGTITEKARPSVKFTIRILHRPGLNFNLWRAFENKLLSRREGKFYIYNLTPNRETTFFSGADGEGVSTQQLGWTFVSSRLYKGVFIEYQYPNTYRDPFRADLQALEFLSKITSIEE